VVASNNFNILNSIKGGLIVSCQAEGVDPFNTPEYVSLFAKAAEIGGAKAIRSEGLEKTKKILEIVNIPVIGLVKSKYPNGFVKITGSYKEVEDLISLNCSIIAIDGTRRIREMIDGPEFINKIKSNFKCCIMADISTYDEGLECFDAGADCISTTLSGYTPNTRRGKSIIAPDFKLLKLLTTLPIPIIAEGRYNYPVQAKKAINLGAWAVTVGTAITRPSIVTSWYVTTMNG